MIRVWSDEEPVGLLDRQGRRGSAFAYGADTAEERAVSMTMPVRTASWNHAAGLAPVFEMNLPEGALRERLRLAFAKATGTFDDFDLLGVVGRSQIGRLRYTAPDAALDEEVPFQSVDELLQRRRDGDLFRYLVDQFAAFSGISGVQPKVMIRDERASAVLSKKNVRALSTFKAATHIVKFWEPEEFPDLAANEFFCLTVARRCGLEVPRFRLSEDGGAIVIDRFDLKNDGTFLGLEDFCVLNARGTADKYRGGYEKALFTRAKDYIGEERWAEQAKGLFDLFVLNCALRNGDAHLKNFALVYDRVTDDPRLAPVYDVVTTTVYLPKDSLALTLDGTTRWPDSGRLERLGTFRCRLRPAEVWGTFDRIAAAMADTLKDIRTYAADHPEFRATAAAMTDAWGQGMRHSLAAPKN